MFISLAPIKFIPDLPMYLICLILVIYSKHAYVIKRVSKNMISCAQPFNSAVLITHLFRLNNGAILSWISEEHDYAVLCFIILWLTKPPKPRFTQL